MKTLVTIASLLSGCALAATSSVAATAQVTARVVYAGTYGNGNVFIGLSSALNEAGCPTDRINIASSHPMAKQFLATAQAALVSGTPITVWTNGCFNGHPTLDSSDGSYLFLDIR